MGSSGFESKVVPTLREGYTLPFRFRPNLTRSPTVISNYHNPAKQSFLLEALYQLVNKNTVQPVEIKLTGQPAIFGTRAQQPVETCPGPEHLEHLFEHRDVQDGNPRDNKNLPPSRGVGHIHRFQAYFHIPIHSQSRKYMRFYLQGRSYQFKPFPLACPQLPWSSQWWPKRSNSWLFRRV